MAINILQRKQLNYDECHKIINGILYKLCYTHSKYFSNDNPWIPCNEEYFYKNNSNKQDGFNPYCKKCTRSKSNIWSKNNNQKQIEYRKQYYIDNIDIWSDRQKIYNDLHKEKNAEKEKEWLRNNKDKLKAYAEKHKEKKHIMTIEEWENCKKYFCHRCAYCGLPIEEHYKNYAGKPKLIDLNKEHVIDAGKNDLANCVPACGSCNSSKREYSLNDWYNAKNLNYTYDCYHKIYLWIRYDYKKFIQRKEKKYNNLSK